MNRYIYRYKYLPDMVGIKGVVQDGTIKFTHPRAFNDPFDCMPSSKFGNLIGLKERNPRLYDVWASQPGSPARRLMKRAQSMRVLRDKIESGELLGRLLKEASVLSLSKIPDSILMWSHYSNFHQGAVVEFKIPISVRYLNYEVAYKDLIALDVDYTGVRPTLEFTGAVVDGPETLRQLFLAKSDHWAYEQESRVIKRLGGCGIFEYNHDLLHSVILGAKSQSYNDVRRCVDAASVSLGRKISLFKAEFDHSAYSVNIPGFHKKPDIPQLDR